MEGNWERETAGEERVLRVGTVIVNLLVKASSKGKGSQ